MYHAITQEQLLGLYPNKQKQVLNLLAYLVRQKRLFLDGDGFYRTTDQPEEFDRGLSAALWILIYFIDRVDYHSIGSEFPTKIVFFAQDEVYEIIYIAYGQEALVNNILSSQAKDPPNYIILVDRPEQIPGIDVPNVSGYCTVSPDGQVQYYQKE